MVSYEEYTADITTRQNNMSVEVEKLIGEGFSVGLAIQKLQEARALEDEARALEFTEIRDNKIKRFSEAASKLRENPQDTGARQELLDTTNGALVSTSDLERTVRDSAELTYEVLVTEDRPAVPSIIRGMTEPDTNQRAKRGESVQSMIDADVDKTTEAAVEGSKVRAKAQQERRDNKALRQEITEANADSTKTEKSADVDKAADLDKNQPAPNSQ